MGKAALLLLVFISACASQERSAAQRAAFTRDNPCPATGQPRGPCPGYVVDHITPLCASGADKPANMQWQTVEAGKLKDKDERAQCRR
jgi:hypothetical protein